MEYLNGLPVIYLDINLDLEDSSGMGAISFVDNPATQTLWTTYSESEFHFAEVRNEEKRMITAPVMLADTPIIRYHESIGKFWTKFNANTIEKMMMKYFMSNQIHNVNEMHNGYRVVDNVYMIESYIVSDKVESKLYPNIPRGSWIATFYIDCQEYWDNNIKTGKFKGISLEGGFIQKTDDYQYAAIEAIISNESLNEEEVFNKIKEIIK